MKHGLDSQQQLVAIEQQLQAERNVYRVYEQSQRRSHSTKLGMSRARQWGKAIGRNLEPILQ